jgi:hypothetical protein
VVCSFRDWMVELSYTGNNHASQLTPKNSLSVSSMNNLAKEMPERYYEHV